MAEEEGERFGKLFLNIPGIRNWGFKTVHPVFFIILDFVFLNYQHNLLFLQSRRMEKNGKKKVREKERKEE